MGEMAGDAGDGGGRSERDEATKSVRKRSHNKMNQHMTGRNFDPGTQRLSFGVCGVL